jgi:hypothetical protein
LSNLLSQQKQTLDLHSGKFSSAQFWQQPELILQSAQQ